MKSENKEKGGDIARAFEGLRTTLWSKPKQTMRIYDGIGPVLRTHTEAFHAAALNGPPLVF